MRLYYGNYSKHRFLFDSISSAVNLLVALEDRSEKQPNVSGPSSAVNVTSDEAELFSFFKVK